LFNSSSHAAELFQPDKIIHALAAELEVLPPTINRLDYLNIFFS